MSDTSFYVYEHWRPDVDVCFYVGKGCGKRARRFKRGPHYNRIVKKLAALGMCVEVRMVASGLNESTAFAIEMDRISFWRAAGVKLANRTDGGEGVRGAMHGAVMRAVHARPEVKIRHRAAVKEAHARPETKERHRVACKESQGRPEVREKTRARMIALRSNPEDQKKRNAALIATLATPEVKAKKRAAMIEVRSRPGMAEKIRAGIKRALATPEVSQKLSATTRGRRWINNGRENKRLRLGLSLPPGWVFGCLVRA